MKRIILLSIAFSAIVAAQDFNLTGAGARAEGFGGAFIGLADDATAVVWNPAGLAQLEKTEGSIVTRFINQSASIDVRFDRSLNEDISQGHFTLNFASLALPLSLGETKIVAAVAFQRQVDFYANHKSENRGIDFSGVYRITNRIKNTGGINTITPAVSVKLAPYVLLGISANIWLGSLESNETYADTRYGTNKYVETADYSGFNLVFGGMVDFEGMKSAIPLKVGVTLRTPFTLTGDGDWNVAEQFPNLDETGTFTVNENIPYTEKTNMPFMLGLGASYRIGDNFTFAADFETRNYGDKATKTDYSSPNYGNFSEENKISQSGKNLTELRFGGEYLLVFDSGVIPARLGFKSVGTELADVDMGGNLSQ
ncbi:MAG: hypothetical protein AB1728_12560, partial [Bacteroidota bacterium]